MPSIRKFAERNNLKIIYFDSSDISDYLKNTNKIAYLLYKPIKNLFKLLTFGKLGDSDLSIIITKI